MTIKPLKSFQEDNLQSLHAKPAAMRSRYSGKGEAAAQLHTACLESIGGKVQRFTKRHLAFEQHI